MSEYGYLAHHGIKGQRWGIRRYQNPDGSLTAEGKIRYDTSLYSKENRSKLQSNYAKRVAITKFKDARETVKKEYNGKLSDDEIDEKAYSLLKSFNPTSYDSLRSYYAYKSEKAEMEKLGKNLLGALGMATVGFGSFTIGNTKAEFYKSKYKAATDNFIRELDNNDKYKIKNGELP